MDALFEIPDSDPGTVLQKCDRCLTPTLASDDGLRVRGWQVYDGLSLTDRPLHVRICPACRTKGSWA